MTTRNRTQLYVGGLHRDVTENDVYASFVPFGPIAEVQLPKAKFTAKHKSFAFVRFEEESDAQAAIENMHSTLDIYIYICELIRPSYNMGWNIDSELYGQVLNVNLSKGDANSTIFARDKPVWAQETATPSTVVDSS